MNDTKLRKLRAGDHWLWCVRIHIPPTQASGIPKYYRCYRHHGEGTKHSLTEMLPYAFRIGCWEIYGICKTAKKTESVYATIGSEKFAARPGAARATVSMHGPAARSTDDAFDGDLDRKRQSVGAVVSARWRHAASTAKNKLNFWQSASVVSALSRSVEFKA